MGCGAALGSSGHQETPGASAAKQEYSACQHYEASFGRPAAFRYEGTLGKGWCELHTSRRWLGGFSRTISLELE